MSRAQEYWIAEQLEPDLARHLFRSGGISHMTANRADIARQRELAAQDQEREAAYQASIERQRTGDNYNEDHLNGL